MVLPVHLRLGRRIGHGNHGRGYQTCKEKKFPQNSYTYRDGGNTVRKKGNVKNIL